MIQYPKFSQSHNLLEGVLSLNMDFTLLGVPFSFGGKVELKWKMAPFREPSEQEIEDEAVRLSEFCCETLRLGGCGKGTKGAGEGGLATDTLPDPDIYRKEVHHEVRTRGNLVVQGDYTGFEPNIA